MSEHEQTTDLVNGCNLEACLRYAHGRIAALESERDELRARLDFSNENGRLLVLKLGEVIRAERAARIEREQGR
jgi:hypothetical protein